VGDKHQANDEESGMMVGKYRKRCPICGAAVKRAKAPYIMGRVVIEPQLEVDKCTKCGEEFYTAEQVARAQEKAIKLGIWKPWQGISITKSKKSTTRS